VKKILGTLSPATRRAIVGITIIIFVFRSMPTFGAGAGWREIDGCGDDHKPGLADFDSADLQSGISAFKLIVRSCGAIAGNISKVQFLKKSSASASNRFWSSSADADIFLLAASAFGKSLRSARDARNQSRLLRSFLIRSAAKTYSIISSM
jgi:hypothetical protein